jgi:multidrug transporter EmrE-like cation transporter
VLETELRASSGQELAHSPELARFSDVQPFCIEPSPQPAASSPTVRHCASCQLPSQVFSEHTWRMIRAASCVAPCWFLANLCFNSALKLTSVTSTAILSSPTSLFTYFLSVLMLHEKFTFGKLAGVGLTIVGTFLRTPGTRASAPRP